MHIYMYMYLQLLCGKGLGICFVAFIVFIDLLSKSDT